MRAVLMCARSDVVRRWRQAVVLALVVAVAGTVVLAAAAGARRTASAFDRFTVSTRAYDVLVFFRSVRPSTVDTVRAINGVEAAALVHAPALQLANGTFVAAGAPTDDVVFRDIARTRIVAGRDVAAGASEEIVIGEPLAEQQGLGVGGSLELVTFTPEQIQALIGEVGTPIPEPDGPRISMKVVGISRSPVDLSQQGDAGGILLLPHAFVEKYGDRIGTYQDVMIVRLKDGSTGVPGFVQVLRETVDDDPAVVIDEIEPTAVSTSGVRESIDVLEIALTVFAGIAAIAAVAVIGFIVARLISFGSQRFDIWQALGLTRAQRAVAMALPALGAIVAGAVLAVVGAWLASTLMPIGLARRATDRISMQRSVVGRVFEVVSLTPSLGVGLRAALVPRGGRGSTPVRSTLIAVTVAVLGVVSVSMFGPSLDHLSNTPTLFGVGWDVAVDDTRAEHPESNRPCSGLIGTRVDDEPGLETVGGICNLIVEVEGHPISAFGYLSMRGSIAATLLDGRAPQAADEIALGSDTLTTVKRGIGDQVNVEGPGGSATYRIVGRVVIPSLGDSQAVADGAILTGVGLDRLDDPAAALSHAWVVATIADGGDRRVVQERLALLPDVGDPGSIGVEGPRLPLEVRRLQQVDHLPLLLAAFLASLGAAALGYALVTSLRRRQREHAVLKTLGFTRRQLAAAIAWHATTVAGIGIAVGLPGGIVVGRLIWRTVSNNTGVAFAPRVSVLVLIGTALAVLAFANVAASVAGRAAGRVSIAPILQSE